MRLVLRTHFADIGLISNQNYPAANASADA
jgi:hypothetical protein